MTVRHKKCICLLKHTSLYLPLHASREKYLKAHIQCSKSKLTGSQGKLKPVLPGCVGHHPKQHSAHLCLLYKQQRISVRQTNHRASMSECVFPFTDGPGLRYITFAGKYNDLSLNKITGGQCIFIYFFIHIY